MEGGCCFEGKALRRGRRRQGRRAQGSYSEFVSAALRLGGLPALARSPSLSFLLPLSLSSRRVSAEREGESKHQTGEARWAAQLISF